MGFPGSSDPTSDEDTALTFPRNFAPLPLSRRSCWGAVAPRCLGKPYASKLILSQTNPRIDAAPVYLAAFVLAVSMCQPGKVTEWHGLRCCSSFGERYRCLQPRPEQVRSAAACDPSGACVGGALTVLWTFIRYGRAKPSARPARKRQGREVAREGQGRVLFGGEGAITRRI